MNNNPEGAKLAKETLTGDIAAFLIDRLRQFPKPYQQMSENEQKEQCEMAKEAARNLVSNAVNIVASAGRKTVKAKLIKYSVKDGCKVELDGAKSIAGELADVVGETVLIVTNTDDEFVSGENKVKADPDQPDMIDRLGNEYKPNSDGEGVPDPEATENEVPALPAPEDPNIIDTEFEEVDSENAEIPSETEENSDVEGDSVDDEFTEAEKEFAEDETQPAA